MSPDERAHYRSIFLSDLHIGFRGFKAAELLAFLKSVECDQLYLVGDIFDLLAIRDGICWDSATTEVIRHILKKVNGGMRLIYITGNHDEAVRNFTPLDLGDRIIVCDEAIHVTASGSKLMVIHGDKFDFVVGHMRWLTHVGAFIYEWLLRANGWLHTIRMRLGFKRYWSLAGFLKLKAKQAISFIRDFETAACRYAQDAGCVGVVCGHIHTPALRIHDGTNLLYGNCGDNLESLSCLVEHYNGHIELLYYSHGRHH